MTLVLAGGELEVVGPMSSVGVRRLPVVSLPWLEDVAAVALMGRNGRPRSAITLPGHGKGRKPGNWGKTYPAEPLTNEEALALIAVIPGDTRAGVRNRALITLLWRTGLRVSEALDLKPHNVDYENRRVTVLKGKGSKRRTVGIDIGALGALQPWLLERAMLGVPSDAPLFCTIQRPGIGNRMTSAYVRAAMHKYGRIAGIPKRVHPHGLRHSLACALIKEGFSLAHVSAQLGHSQMSTTCVYLRGLGADEAFEAVAERSWPGGAS